MPEEIHRKWLAGGNDRDELLHILEEANFKKDQPCIYLSRHIALCKNFTRPPYCTAPFCQEPFLKKIERTKEKVSRQSKNKKRGWFTEEGMRTKLGWSKLLGIKIDILKKHVLKT